MSNTTMVTTYSNNSVPRSRCRKIKGIYYEINVDCFLVEGKWNRINNGLITKDYSTDSYVKVAQANEEMQFGVVDENNGVPVTGYFSKPPLTNNNIYVRKGNDGDKTSLFTHDHKLLVEDVAKLPSQTQSEIVYSKTTSLKCMSEDVAKKLGYSFSFTDNIMYPQTSGYKSKFKKSLGIGYGNLNYGSDNAIPEGTAIYNKTKNQIRVSAEHRRIHKLMGDYSFGLEFETRNGYVATPILNKLGLIPVKDGSLRLDNGKIPYEFVTIPFKGAKGIATLDGVCNVLQERTSFDSKCSMHLHVGNVPKDELFILAMYKLIYMVQNELLTMFPLYKTHPNGKNYAKKLSNSYVPKTIPNFRNLTKDELQEYISASFNRVYFFASDGKYPGREYNRTKLRHPVTGSKWNISSRYSIINFVPLLFKSFGTLEFRVHTPTTNRTKVFNWLLFCTGLIKFATHHPDKIISQKTIKLDTIMNQVYGEDAKGLISYMNDRKAMFANEQDTNGSIERAADEEYTHNSF